MTLADARYNNTPMGECLYPPKPSAADTCIAKTKVDNAYS